MMDTNQPETKKILASFLIGFMCNKTINETKIGTILTTKIRECTLAISFFNGGGKFD